MPKIYKAPFYTEEQIEELDENEMSFPFSSKYMRYDSLKRQYIPTQARFYVNNDDPTKSTGLDMEQKQWLNKGVLFIEDRQVDTKVKALLLDLGLMWTGSYDNQFAPYVLKEDW